MDPNANLQAQHAILARHGNLTGRKMPAAEVTRLRELRAALWGWLDAGGFQPDWAAAPLAAPYFGRLGFRPGATHAPR